MRYINVVCLCLFFFFKPKTAYEMRISDWSSDVCSSDLIHIGDRDVGLDLVARHALRRRCVVDRIDQREQPGGAVAVAHLREREDRPLRAVRVLATVLAPAGRIGLDVAGVVVGVLERRGEQRSEEHTTELQSLMRISYAVFCLKKKN